MVELVIRLTGFGSRPQDFFKSGWNVFDFLVVAASFTPGLRENAMLLRLARLARVLRIVRLLPDLRVLTVAIGRSIPGVMSLSDRLPVGMSLMFSITPVSFIDRVIATPAAFLASTWIAMPANSSSPLMLNDVLGARANPSSCGGAVGS